MQNISREFSAWAEAAIWGNRPGAGTDRQDQEGGRDFRGQKGVTSLWVCCRRFALKMKTEGLPFPPSARWSSLLARELPFQSRGHFLG